MNPKRLIIAIIVAYITTFATDILIHGVWLQPVYKATMNLWRTEAEMQSHTGCLMAGQFLAATMFVLIWARGFAAGARPLCAVRYGLCMGVFLQSFTLIDYAVAPLTAEIAWKWFVSGVLQSIVLGLVTFAVYKPLAPDAAK